MFGTNLACSGISSLPMLNTWPRCPTTKLGLQLVFADIFEMVSALMRIITLDYWKGGHSPLKKVNLRGHGIPLSWKAVKQWCFLSTKPWWRGWKILENYVSFFAIMVNSLEKRRKTMQFVQKWWFLLRNLDGIGSKKLENYFSIFCNHGERSRKATKCVKKWWFLLEKPWWHGSKNLENYVSFFGWLAGWWTVSKSIEMCKETMSWSRNLSWLHVSRWHHGLHTWLDHRLDGGTYAPSKLVLTNFDKGGLEGGMCSLEGQSPSRPPLLACGAGGGTDGSLLIRGGGMSKDMIFEKNLDGMVQKIWKTMYHFLQK